MTTESKTTLGDFLSPREKEQFGDRFSHYMHVPLAKTGVSDMEEIDALYRPMRRKWEEDHKDGIKPLDERDPPVVWQKLSREYEIFFWARVRAQKAGWIVPSHIVEGNDWEPPSILSGTLYLAR